MRGTAVTMLTGQRQNGLQCIRCGAKCPPLQSGPNVSLAIERLRTFAFVGLTDEWALSICLLHVIHGPTFGTERCVPAEFFNSREVRFHITVYFEGSLMGKATLPRNQSPDHSSCPLSVRSLDCTIHTSIPYYDAYVVLE